MTINIAIAVSEGLVMAADSLSQMSKGDGQRVETLHQSVEKITEIRGRPMALMINGLGEIRKRTIISLVREFEFDQYARPNAPIRTWTVEQVTSNLTSFIARCYLEAYPVPTSTEGATVSRPDLGIIVGGYSPHEFFPEVFEIGFPAGNWHRRFPAPGAENEYLDFWGQKAALERLLYGYDSSAIDRAQYAATLVEALRKGEAVQGDVRLEDLDEVYRGLPPPPDVNLAAELAGLRRLIRMQSRLNGMPLQEAVEFAEYLGNAAIGYDRFKVGMPAVGGELDVVAIQPDGLHWYKRKPFLQKMADAREAALGLQEREQMRSALGTMQKIAEVIGAMPTEPVESPAPPASAEPPPDQPTSP